MSPPRPATIGPQRVLSWSRREWKCVGAKDRRASKDAAAEIAEGGTCEDPHATSLCSLPVLVKPRQLMSTATHARPAARPANARARRAHHKRHEPRCRFPSRTCASGVSEPWGTTFRPTSTLVTSGSYAFTRNPMYVSMALLTIACALFLNTWWTVLLLLPTLLIVQQFVVVPEERYLRRRFGAEYEAYTRRVRRWL